MHSDTSCHTSHKTENMYSSNFYQFLCNNCTYVPYGDLKSGKSMLTAMKVFGMVGLGTYPTFAVCDQRKSAHVEVCLLLGLFGAIYCISVQVHRNVENSKTQPTDRIKIIYNALIVLLNHQNFILSSAIFNQYSAECM